MTIFRGRRAEYKMFCRGILEKIQPARRAFGKRKEKRIKGKRYGSGGFCISFLASEKSSQQWAYLTQSEKFPTSKR